MLIVRQYLIHHWKTDALDCHADGIYQILVIETCKSHADNFGHIYFPFHSHFNPARTCSDHHFKSSRQSWRWAAPTCQWVAFRTMAQASLNNPPPTIPIPAGAATNPDRNDGPDAAPAAGNNSRGPLPWSLAYISALFEALET